ncbi:MAG TPA: response regulator [Actinomycetota bacterium]
MGERQASATNGSRARVLIADDDPLVRDLLEAVLEANDFELLTAADGLEAVRMAREAIPNVVVLDVMMPGANGFDVCRTLRAEARFDETRIVMLTARTSPRDREEGIRAGADAFFTKPFSPLDLIEAVTGGRNGDR